MINRLYSGGFQEGIVAEGHALDIVVQPYEGLGVWQGKGFGIDIGVGLEGVDEHQQYRQYVE